MRQRITIVMMGALVLLGGLLAGGASQAEAQVTIAGGQQIPGFPVGARSTVHPQWMFAIGNKIVMVNQAGEVWTHDIRGNRVLQALQSRGETIGVRGQRTRMVFPVGRNIIVITDGGSVYQQRFGEQIGPAQPIGEIPRIVDAAYLFPVGGNHIVNITRNGEIWVYTVGPNRVAQGRLLNRIATGGSPRHVFSFGNVIFTTWPNGTITAHMLTRAGTGPTRTVNHAGFLNNPWRFVFQMGRTLIGVTEDGRVFRHAINVPGEGPQPEQ